MILDFNGGLFSFIQLILEFYLNPNLHINITKLFLSLISMVYDVTYMIQHYVLYRNK
jgi:cystinosin